MALWTWGRGRFREFQVLGQLGNRLGTDPANRLQVLRTSKNSLGGLAGLRLTILDNPLGEDLANSWQAGQLGPVGRIWIDLGLDFERPSGRR